jgi:hypothetical protein
MSDAITGLLDAVGVSSPRCCLGSILDITSDDRPIVTYSGCAEGGIAAGVLSESLQVRSLKPSQPVLLLFPDGQQQPVILGTVSDTVATATRAANDSDPPEHAMLLDRPDTVLADNKRIVIEAQNEIHLKCGKSSIVLHRDGKVIIKGKKLVSRASETNKVRGGAVIIN